MKKKIICFNKEYKSVAELAREYNVSYRMVCSRLHRGYSYEDAITLTPEQARKNSLNNFKVNHQKLSEEVVRERFREAGYEIIEYNYKNNLTPLLCYDNENYKIKISLANIKNKPMKFSVTYNKENFLYNINNYIKINNIPNKAIDYDIDNKYKHPRVLFECGCGTKYWYDFESWKYEYRYLCPYCRKSISKYEQMTIEYLKEKQIKYVRQKTFDGCKYKNSLLFDFYLPDYNCCIEVDGEQHFEDRFSFHRGNDSFEDVKLRDSIKNKYCEDNNIPLLRIPYWEFKTNNYKQAIDNFILK